MAGSRISSTPDGRRSRPARDSAVQTLSARLRALRLERNLSLSDVADATHISPSFLSLVENGKSDITIGRLTRLVEFFGISITDLLPAQEPETPHIVRREERPQLHSSAEDIDIALLTPDTARMMMPILLEFEPGAERAEPGRHRAGTEEFLHVISGELILEVEGAGSRRLRAGDSAYYPGDRPHLFRNASKKRPLRVLCVNSPPVL